MECCFGGPNCLRCSFQRCCFCSCIVLLILLFSGASCASLEFCFPDSVSVVYGCSYVFWKEFMFIAYITIGVYCACRQQSQHSLVFCFPGVRLWVVVCLLEFVLFPLWSLSNLLKFVYILMGWCIF